MATKPLKTLTFEGLNDTYTVPQVDTTLSVTGGAADAKAAGDALATKADKIGNIALAERLYGGEYTSESEPYHFRQAPEGMGSKSETIVGGSLAWNQLIDTAYDFHSPYTHNGLTFTRNNDGSITVNGTVTGGTNAYCQLSNATMIIANHVYLMTSGSSNQTINMWHNITTGSAKPINIIKPSGAGSGFYLRVNTEGTVVNSVIVNPQAIDLTTLFGTTIADYIYTLETATVGAGVAWVKRYIDLDTYHEYDAGSIKSVEGLVSHDVVGFNQWDEEWEVGWVNTSTGASVTANDAIRSKNFIPILPNTTYYVRTAYTASSQRPYMFFYDTNKTYLYETHAGAGFIMYTTPQNACYMKIAVANLPTPVTYNHDICINLSDPSRNGTYEPYEKHSYPLDSDVVLRGVPKLVTDHIEFDGDKYLSNGTVERRYGVVDLGSLTWAAHDSSRSVFRGTSISNKRTPTNNAFCVGYEITTAAFADMTDKTMRGTTDLPTGWFIRDTAYTDAAAFKTAMSGVYLVYELATPTTETAQPFQSPMVVGATEEYVSDSVVPVGHESKYYEDVAKKVNGLPKDFSTLIAPVEVTFTATRNYSVGSYMIVKNQLYKVTSAISTGGTITPNSNVTATTIMAEILALA